MQLSVSEARATLPAVLDRVEAGDEVTITRHGKPVAVLLRPDAVPARPLSETEILARRVRAELEAARHRPLRPPGLSVEYAEELIAQIRADRDAR